MPAANSQPRPPTIHMRKLAHLGGYLTGLLACVKVINDDGHRPPYVPGSPGDDVAHTASAGSRPSGAPALAVASGAARRGTAAAGAAPVAGVAVTRVPRPGRRDLGRDRAQ